MLPIMNRKQRKQIRFDSFALGIDLSRDPSLISSSHLSDGENVYAQGGALRTRPALKSAYSLSGGTDKVRVHDEIMRLIDGREYTLTSLQGEKTLFIFASADDHFTVGEAELTGDYAAALFCDDL